MGDTVWCFSWLQETAPAWEEKTQDPYPEAESRWQPDTCLRNPPSRAFVRQMVIDRSLPYVLYWKAKVGARNLVSSGKGGWERGQILYSSSLFKQCLNGRL